MKQITTFSNRCISISVLVTVSLIIVFSAIPSEAKKYAAASWYGKEYHGRRTSSGIVYDMNSSQAAHKTLPFGANLRVTNPKNGKSTKVKITDRGPFTKSRDIDLSYKCAKDIGIVSKGVAKVKIDYILKDGSKTKYVDITDTKTLPDRLDKIAFVDYKNAVVMKRLLKGTEHTRIVKSNVGGRPVYIVSTREKDTRLAQRNPSTSNNETITPNNENALAFLKLKLDKSKAANTMTLMTAYESMLTGTTTGMNSLRPAEITLTAARSTGKIHS